ncbi:MAG TPA: hypothetical protein VK400_12765 [Pyrinomonadaceae bacterium]|nr:hypothetical protein [Pyrinomonadaceae bacterium]
MKFLFFVGFIVLILTVSEAAACGCIYIPTHSVDFRKSKAVFIGEVIDNDVKMPFPEDLRNSPFMYAIKFRLEKSWKGAKSGEFTAWAGYIGGCGFKPLVGKKYLVYVRKYKGNHIFDTACSRARPIEFENEETRKEMKQLNDAWFRFRSNFAFFNFR